MTEITDLSTTDGSNTSISGEVVSGSTFMTRTDNVFHAVMGLMARSIRTDVLRFLDHTDDTKRLAFDLSGITTAITRTLAAPDASGTIALTDDPWALQPIGVPLPLFDNITGTAVPPTNKAYRYVELTAGKTGSGQYNENVLTSESVSGSAPLVQATAVISLSGSPLNGQTVRLINTERRFLRAGSAGTVEADAMQQITGTFAARTGTGTPTGAVTAGGTSSADAYTPGGNTFQTHTFNSANSSGARTDTETRAKNIGATYYMRIK